EANERRASTLKSYFDGNKILCLNLMSSPGAGKTSLLERTLADLKGEFRMAVIEGDLQTDNDARRVAATGAQAVQVNTEGGCHLDSSMIEDAIAVLDMKDLDILFIENVGNLVCPAEFNLGEDHKVSILSVTEGDDKPEKYPLMFHLSSVMLLNKTDLLPYVDFSLETASAHARKLNKGIEIFPVACRTNEGLGPWYDWLRKARASKR
ncbi:MAG: hydrogenase nickel incorporation protein HypB, partial [Humidesulfovibrio sp.]|nr:hydrogenase nickel incorporation protein HypB [Humidesulfovibrio sp.]